MGPQINALRRGVDIVIATPGRLIDHMQQRTLDLSGVETLILDEADRMLDMGFLPALKRILQSVPKKRQTLLFSATFAPAIKTLAMEFMHNPKEISVSAPNTVTTLVSHQVHPVDAARKRDLLLHLLSVDSRRQSLVFSRTKHGADKLVTFLNASGLRSAAIHGNKSQNARTRALSDFKSGRVTVMVATDIAARGIDIEQLPIVINYDLPSVAEDYVHRIGRTGRAGMEGLAVSLVSHDESGLLYDIRKLLKQEIAITAVDRLRAVNATAHGCRRAASEAGWRWPAPAARAAPGQARRLGPPEWLRAAGPWRPRRRQPAPPLEQSRRCQGVSDQRRQRKGQPMGCPFFACNTHCRPASGQTQRLRRDGAGGRR